MLGRARMERNDFLVNLGYPAGPQMSSGRIGVRRVRGLSNRYLNFSGGVPTEDIRLYLSEQRY